MLPVLRTEQAEADLVEVLERLEEFSPPAAERLVAKIDERCALLAQLPEMGRAREELASGLRSLAIDKYVLFYRVTAAAVEVLRILHGARDIETIMREEE